MTISMRKIPCLSNACRVLHVSSLRPSSEVLWWALYPFFLDYAAFSSSHSLVDLFRRLSVVLLPQHYQCSLTALRKGQQKSTKEVSEWRRGRIGGLRRGRSVCKSAGLSEKNPRKLWSFLEKKSSWKGTFAPNNITLHLYLECSRKNIVELSLTVIIPKHWSRHHKDSDQNISVAQNFLLNT